MFKKIGLKYRRNILYKKNGKMYIKVDGKYFLFDIKKANKKLLKVC